MFKAILLSLAMASGLHATVNNTTPIEELNGGLDGPALVPVGTPVYALSQGLTGTGSSAIDLSGTAGILACISATGAANVTGYYWNTNLSQTTGAVSMFSINAAGCYPVKPKARFVSFYNSANQATNRVSLNYLPMVAPPVTISGSSTVTGNVFITGTVKVDAQGSSVIAWSSSSYVFSTSTAYQATTTGLAVNISSLAGATCNDCKVYWQTPGNIYWDYGASSTIPGTLGATTGFTLTANVTPLLDSGFVDGQFLYLKGQTGTVNIQVTVRKRQ